MKKAKKIIKTALFFAAFSALFGCVNAKEPAYIYSTDILAYVNGSPIPSYNIGGKTVIIAEDLDGASADASQSYGFSVWYSDESRTLTINSNGGSPSGEISVERGTVGETVGQVYESDIKVLFNSFEITGYNIGGRTAVCIEELGVFDETSPNYEYGFSKYMCNSSWDAENRIISLNTYQALRSDYPGHKTDYLFKDNRLYMTFDNLNSFDNNISTDFSEEFISDTYKIKDVFYGETDERIGEIYVNSAGTFYYNADIYALKKIISEIEKPMTYSEAIDYIEKNYTVLNTLENENAKAYLAETDGTKYLLLAVKKGRDGFVKAYEFSPSYTGVELIKSDNENEFNVKVSPFAGPHGATDAIFCFESEYYIYE